jgi:chromate reductase, NAD(P)H dehydrogenase (quinone)
MRLLAISGSLRQRSYNSALLDAAAAACARAAQFVVWRGLADIPPYNEDLGETPTPVAELRREITSADAVLIATPEYNGSIPGALKNALDWASRPFPDNCLRRKPVSIIGASTGLFGARWAQAELRKVLKTIGASVLETELPVSAAHEAFTNDGRLREPQLAAALCNIVSELVQQTLQDAARPAAANVRNGRGGSAQSC